MFNKKMLFMLMMAAALVTGCSDNSPSNPKSGFDQMSAIIRGEVPQDQLDFEIPAELGKGFDDTDQGAIMVRGRNLAYDSDLGVMMVDLSVFNDSQENFPEPVGLTFVQFIPADVTIANSDNDLDGVGALLMFDFTDSDGNWGPGEESQIRTVQFNVASGVSIGFVARVDVGVMPGGGAIGGMVWQDENEDGMIDPDEAGVGGVMMTLHAGQDSSSATVSMATTAEDGSYLFEGQDAGFYTVVREPKEGLMGTTPSEMAVILVEIDGAVSDFLLANFGVKAGDMPPVDDRVRVGDFVKAQGEYQAEPHRLYASKFEVKRCDGDDDRDHDDDDGYGHGDDDDDDDDKGRDHDRDHDGDRDDDHGNCRENNCWGRLAGPVTDVNWDEGYFEIMGTKVYGQNDDHDDDDGDDDDGDHDGDDDKTWDGEHETGVRLRVDATRDLEADDAPVIACKKPRWWNGNRDRIDGFVQEVRRDDDGNITGVIVLNTLIEMNQDEDDSH